MWESIQYVTSSLTLVAFLASVIAWAFKSKSEERERLIKTTSEEQRAELVRLALQFFDVDTAGLTREQRYELALAQIHARARRFRTTAIVVCIVALTFAGQIVRSHELNRLLDKPGSRAPKGLMANIFFEADGKRHG